MKNALLLLLLLLGPLVASAQEKNDLRFKTQRTVVYPVSDTARLDIAVKWYTEFFGVPYDTLRKDVPNSYAVFMVDGTEVRLETDPKYLGLKEPLFYWMLPTPEAVIAKLESLKETSRFNKRFFKRLRDFSYVRATGRPANNGIAAENVVYVTGFIVYDPEGNEVGVTNNPIYIPRR
ncbi:hypothetical protein D0N36_04885 [Hymenobacter lapidiphilus]|uniref:hypothetical protein n=1 Tax=Hymenobacter sp. CCM 8763 TaxID=2303334 RepID=UPI000E3426CC|nr:hypothetical protein [Hymenobacter sp. CCM 8763]RFP66352.1 hypothetical protein D0N36_04885 [Hymenobacter sp. CCM 8763]